MGSYRFSKNIKIILSLQYISVVTAASSRHLGAINKRVHDLSELNNGIFFKIILKYIYIGGNKNVFKTSSSSSFSKKLLQSPQKWSIEQIRFLVVGHSLT